MPKNILQGYVQRKKKLISPINSLNNIKSYGYVNDLLPELLWLGLINNYSGYLIGRDVLECVTTLEKEWPKPEAPMNFALQSSYKNLSETQKEELLNSWQKKNLLHKIRNALAPLVLFYDRFSLRFIGPPDSIISQDALIKRLETVISLTSNKYDTPGVMLHGALFLNNLMADRIRISSEIDLPDFEAVIHAIDSPEGKRAAGFLRASAMAQIGFISLPSDWAEYFWSTSYSLVPCRGAQ
jgi:hypothetical protein